MPLPAGYTLDQPQQGATPAAVKLPAGYTLDAPASAAAATPAPKPQPDIFEQAVNYHTGNDWIDAPLGLVQGAAKGIASTGVGIGALARKAVGLPPLPEHTFDADTNPDGIGQGTGKFLEQAAEYAVPASEVGTALKGASLGARALGQAAVGAGVSAAQSGGDPTATAVGGLLGGATEYAGAAVSGAKKLLADKAPTLANFAESFGGATPTQKARITKALGTLTKDGIVPPEDVHATQDVIKGKIDDLEQAYQNLDPAIRARQQPVQYIVRQLQSAQAQFTRRGVITDAAGYNALQSQIDTVEGIAKKNGGNLELDDLLHMKQQANGKTNFNSTKAEKSLWETIGDAYRGAADVLAPETTPLNQDYARYKDLEHMIDQNIARGKGVTPSGLDLLLKRAAAHGTGAAAGASLGGAVGGPVGAAVGGVAGGIVGPKLAKATMQAVQNAIDSGHFAALPKSKQLTLQMAAKIGDNAAVLKILGLATTEETAVSSR